MQFLHSQQVPSPEECRSLTSSIAQPGVQSLTFYQTPDITNMCRITSEMCSRSSMTFKQHTCKDDMINSAKLGRTSLPSCRPRNLSWGHAPASRNAQRWRQCLSQDLLFSQNRPVLFFYGVICGREEFSFSARMVPLCLRCRRSQSLHIARESWSSVGSWLPTIKHDLSKMRRQNKSLFGRRFTSLDWAVDNLMS